jgi:hypothetical protein
MLSRQTQSSEGIDGIGRAGGIDAHADIAFFSRDLAGRDAGIEQRSNDLVGIRLGDRGQQIDRIAAGREASDQEHARQPPAKTAHAASQAVTDTHEQTHSHTEHHTHCVFRI